MKKFRGKKLEESSKLELKKILYDEARKLSTNQEDAKALADEAYLDFKMHLRASA